MADFYEIKVKGHLNPEWAGWFDNLELRQEKEDETILTGPVADQSALLGIIAQLFDLRVILLSVRLISPDYAA